MSVDCCNGKEEAEEETFFKSAREINKRKGISSFCSFSLSLLLSGISVNAH
jgi:hypothetical protein